MNHEKVARWCYYFEIFSSKDFSRSLLTVPKSCCIFLNLGKAFDRVTRKVIWCACGGTPPRRAPRVSSDGFGAGGGNHSRRISDLRGHASKLSSHSCYRRLDRCYRRPKVKPWTLLYADGDMLLSEHKDDLERHTPDVIV